MAQEPKTPAPKERAKTVLDSRFGPFQAYENDFINDQVTLFGNHTRPEFAFATAVIDHDADLFDLGAHIGTFSASAVRKLAPGRRILAVEGHPVTYRLLDMNMAAHGQGQVHCLNALVGGAETYEFVEDRKNSGAVWARPAAQGAFAAQTIDGLVEQHFAPAYIKIDIEGAELRCLSASAYVRDTTPILYMEVSRRQFGNHGSTVEDLDALLRGLGYVVYRNIGDRNARHDLFRVAREEDLVAVSQERKLFDILCVREGQPAQEALERAAGLSPSLR